MVLMMKNFKSTRLPSVKYMNFTTTGSGPVISLNLSPPTISRWEFFGKLDFRKMMLLALDGEAWINGMQKLEFMKTLVSDKDQKSLKVYKSALK